MTAPAIYVRVVATEPEPGAPALVREYVIHARDDDDALLQATTYEDKLAPQFAGDLPSIAPPAPRRAPRLRPIATASLVARRRARARATASSR